MLQLQMQQKMQRPGRRRQQGLHLHPHRRASRSFQLLPQQRADEVKVGQQLEGQVVGVTDFGLFVDVGGSVGTGMVHVSSIHSKEFVSDPRKLFKAGDEVTCWFEGWKSGHKPRFSMINPWAA